MGSNPDQPHKCTTKTNPRFRWWNLLCTRSVCKKKSSRQKQFQIILPLKINSLNLKMMVWEMIFLFQRCTYSQVPLLSFRGEYLNAFPSDIFLLSASVRCRHRKKTGKGMMKTRVDWKRKGRLQGNMGDGKS